MFEAVMPYFGYFFSIVFLTTLKHTKLQLQIVGAISVALPVLI